MIQTIKNESTTTNANSNVYMKYMSDFIIYLYNMELIETIRMTEGKTGFHIYKVNNQYDLYVFNQVSDTYMGFSSDTIEGIHERIDSMKKWKD